MDDTDHNLLSRLIEAGADALDLTPTQYERAVGHYEAVGEYLAESGPLERFSPVVFAQGSIAIGTATKPVGRDEFDLDSMCQMRIRSDADPSVVKRIIGDRLKDHQTYCGMLREKNRCWRLVYAGEFHMDIIPGIPDPQRTNGTALLVPDRDLQCWKETDPKGYTEWFLNRAQITTVLKEAMRAEVEPAPPSPDKRRKFALQVVVQLLKRHRDLMFAGNPDAPISIILTTLAARAYDGSRSPFSALSSVLERMPSYIGQSSTGDALVENPVNPDENFADKWGTHPSRERCFYEWLARARQDLERLRTARLPDMEKALGVWVGERAATGAIKDYGEAIQRLRSTGLNVSAATGAVASTSPRAARSPNHTFFGR
ncbi:MAG: nucleotidyltransferase [Gammaproteobacteria bacterium]|nr:nucleotidyltransferase [Gammaproteobacteria bacterium]